MLNTSLLQTELRAWTEAGLIPKWNSDTMQDKVLADVLRAIREHITITDDDHNGD